MQTIQKFCKNATQKKSDEYSLMEDPMAII